LSDNFQLDNFRPPFSALFPPSPSRARARNPPPQDPTHAVLLTLAPFLQTPPDTPNSQSQQTKPTRQQSSDIPGEVKAGYSPIGFVRCGRAACKMTKINWKVGKETGGKKLDAPHALKANEMAEVRMITGRAGVLVRAPLSPAFFRATGRRGRHHLRRGLAASFFATATNPPPSKPTPPNKPNQQLANPTQTTKPNNPTNNPPTKPNLNNKTTGCLRAVPAADRRLVQKLRGPVAHRLPRRQHGRHAGQGDDGHGQGVRRRQGPDEDDEDVIYVCVPSCDDDGLCVPLPTCIVSRGAARARFSPGSLGGEKKRGGSPLVFFGGECFLSRFLVPLFA